MPRARAVEVLREKAWKATYDVVRREIDGLKRVFVLSEKETGPRYFGAARQYFAALCSGGIPTTQMAGEDTIVDFKSGKCKRRLLFCDVGAPNLHIFRSNVIREQMFSTSRTSEQYSRLMRQHEHEVRLDEMPYIHEEAAVSEASIGSDVQGIKIWWEEVEDEFDGDKVKWRQFSNEQLDAMYELSFKENKTVKVLQHYLPRVLGAPAPSGTASVHSPQYPDTLFLQMYRMARHGQES